MTCLLQLQGGVRHLRSQAGRKVLPQPKVSDRSLPVPSGSTCSADPTAVFMLPSPALPSITHDMRQLQK
jgi:hypothetical protein